jgi:hypothetical protein
MDALFLLVVVGIIWFLCWKCDINKSMILLILLLGISVVVLAYPGTESFYVAGLPPSPPVTTDNLEFAGIARPSVFNCMDKIGITAEMSPLFATKYDV